MKTALLILLLPSIAFAQLALSEIMANEPGDTTQYEWIEIYNYQDFTIHLIDYKLAVGSDTTQLPPYDIEAHSYAILARQLVADGGLPSFESRWGNASTYWGDDPAESFTAIDINLVLPNAGSMGLLGIFQGDRDTCRWTSDIPDGISYERDALLSRTWHPCTDPTGSTPGRVNSPPPEPDSRSVEIGIESRTISMTRHESFRISIISPTGSRGRVEIIDDTGRRLYTLLDGPISTECNLSWSGWGHQYNRPAPGVYFVLVTVSGSANVTKTIPVVIAP